MLLVFVKLAKRVCGCKVVPIATCQRLELCSLNRKHLLRTAAKSLSRDARAARGSHRRRVSFPQMPFDQQAKRGWLKIAGAPDLSITSLAFNISTAFSPTDSPVLSRWAKSLMMVQALISFTTVALLAARAVNIL